MKSPSRFLIGLLALMAFIACALYAATIYQRIRVAAFLREFTSVRLGTTTFTEAQEIANRYGANASGIREQDPCSSNDCVFDFVFKNWLLNHLQRQRKISLAAGLVIRNGCVTSRELDYSILATSGDHQFMYVLFDRGIPEGDKGYTIQESQINVQGVAHNVEIHLGSNAPVGFRNLACSVNLACLIKVSGCDILPDILPSQWSGLEAK